jgi:hypothetical protein
MMKTLRTLTVALAAAALVPLASASAQEAAFGKGSKVLDLGIVIDDPTGFAAAFEVGLIELAPNLTLGVGATGSYQSESSVSLTWIAGMANVHYSLPDLPKLDLFAGAALGISRVSIDGLGGLGLDGSSSDVGVGINIGARYMFTPKIGGIVRLGIEDAPDLIAGLSIKF